MLDFMVVNNTETDILLARQVIIVMFIHNHIHMCTLKIDYLTSTVLISRANS